MKLKLDFLKNFSKRVYNFFYYNIKYKKVESNTYFHIFDSEKEKNSQVLLYKNYEKLTFPIHSSYKVHFSLIKDYNIFIVSTHPKFPDMLGCYIKDSNPHIVSYFDYMAHNVVFLCEDYKSFYFSATYRDSYLRKIFKFSKDDFRTNRLDKDALVELYNNTSVDIGNAYIKSLDYSYFFYKNKTTRLYNVKKILN